MDNKEFYDKMKNLLLKIPGARIASGGREVIMPCRYCQDHGLHMYVSLPMEGNLMLHNCYRASCGASGVVTHKKIMEWGLFSNPDDLESIAVYNKNVSKLDKNKKFVGQDVYKLNNNFISDNELSKVKLKFINWRLGTNLTFEDCIKNKIVLNLQDLLVANHINKYTRHENIVNELDESFIGFISKDNAFVNLRNLREGNVHKSINLRYINYNIFNKFDTTQRYYTIPTSINITDPNPIKFHLAEGAFDILSIYYNLRKQEDHSIYSAILGGSYINAINHFIVTLGVANLEIHVYPDKDVYTSNDYNKLLDKLRDIKYTFQIPIYIHMNIFEGQKDFGVPIDKINEQIMEL